MTPRIKELCDSMDIGLDDLEALDEEDLLMLCAATSNLHLDVEKEFYKRGVSGKAEET